MFGRALNHIFLLAKVIFSQMIAEAIARADSIYLGNSLSFSAASLAHALEQSILKLQKRFFKNFMTFFGVA